MSGPAQEVLALAERFTAAVERGDAEEARACYAPDARIWHNFDNVEQTVDDNLKVLAWLGRRLRERRYRIIRREPLPDGFLQQHVLEGVLADGSAFRMPACCVFHVKDGRIVRLEEYLDSAQSALLQKSR